MPVLKLSDLLFKKLDEFGIEYCHWKSNIRLLEGLEGKTDLDLLVRADQAREFEETIGKLGFRSMISESWKLYPSIFDFIGLDEESGRFLHLHVHYKIITGRSLLKEYHLPWEGEILSSGGRSFGVRVPSPEMECLIHIIRMAMKRNKLNAKALAKRLLGKISNFSKDLEELEWLTNRSNTQNFDRILDSLEIEGIAREHLRDIASNPDRVSRKTLNSIKIAMKKNRRFGRLQGLILLVAKRLIQIYAFFGGRKGKTLDNGGYAFALLGTDGAGKTTLSHLLSERLGWKLRVKTIYLGSSRYSFRTFLIVLFTLPFRLIERILPGVLTHSLPMVFYRILLEVTYAWDRYGRFKKGKRTVEEGGIVIYERFPIPGIIDWPLWLDKEASIQNLKFVPNVRKYLENIYNKIISPDLFIFLDIPSQAASRRKAGHSNSMIAEKNGRLRSYFGCETDAVHAWQVDATMSPEEILKTTTKGVWQQI